MDWPHLTRIAHKAELYARETYFREGLGDARRILGGEAAAIVRDSALLMVKPDGLAAGKTRPALAFLDAHGFLPVAARSIALDRVRWRELWRYQLTAATLDRLAVNDLVLRGEALLLLLRQSPTHALPATVRLSSLKGSADVARQQAGSLRRQLQQPNRVFSFVHVADEPADLVREMGLLLDEGQRPALWAALARARLTAADQDILEHWSRRPARSLALGAALDRIDTALSLSLTQTQTHTQARTRHAAGLSATLAQLRRGERIAWRGFAQALAATDLQLAPWDLAILGAHGIVCDEPGAPKLIEGVDPGLWLGAAPPL